MNSSFFRKYADIITEASAPPRALGARSAATKLDRLVWRIVDLAGASDSGYEWLEKQRTPLGNAWNAFFNGGHSNSMDFSDYLMQNVDPRVVQAEAAKANAYLSQAKMDLQITEASDAPQASAPPIDDETRLAAKKLGKAAWRIIDMAGASDDGFEELELLSHTPFGAAWAEYFDAAIDEGMTFAEYLMQYVNPQVLKTEAAKVGEYISWAKEGLANKRR